MPDPMFNSEELSDFKRLAALGLLGGSSLAGFKYIRPGALFGSKPQVIGSPVVEVPVPGQEALPSTTDFFEKIRKQKAKGKGKKVQAFKPSAKVSIQDEEKKAFSNKSLSNPAYLAAAVSAIGLPAIGSYYLIDKLNRAKLKADHAKELEDAKKEFGEALVESHSNRLNKPVVINKEASHRDSSLSEDLEKLASLCLREKRAEVPDVIGGVGRLVSLPIQGAGTALSYLGDLISDPAKPLRSYGNLLGGLLVGGGLAGAVTGYRNAVKNDPEKLQSERYLNEFLTRRQNEGMPVHSIPVPVRQVGKKLVVDQPNEDSTDK